MIPPEVAEAQRERMRKLAEDPRNVVLEVNHDEVVEAWPAARVRAVLERIVARITSDEFAPDDSDFKVRKACLDDEEILAFQRRHKKLYWVVTDRRMMKQDKYRNALRGMLGLRDEIDAGRLQDGDFASAQATRVVVDALREPGPEA